jgi:outer membrane protein assembly factor BamD
MKQFWAIASVLAILAGSGCSLRKPPTGQDYYAQGELMFESHNYNNAIENYQHLIDQFPFSPYAEDAELKIALSFYQLREFPEAINALNDFQRMHPTNKDLPMASYYLAMAYYDQIRRPDQDQTNTENALNQFLVLERRFPESPFAQLAHDRIEVCRELLARNELFIGDYYYKRANFRAAESRMAELMQKYPDTPVAPEALYKLAVTLQKEGKKYSAAQAFAALKRHFPDTKYAATADQELKKLKQPIDNEEDPLRLVLAESGFGPADTDRAPRVVVRQREGSSVPAPEPAKEAAAAAYGPDGLPILDRPAAKAQPKVTTVSAAPATLRSVRLASSDPPLSVIFDISGPVKFEKHLESGPGYSTLTVRLLRTSPDAKLERHLVFDRSIFKDSDITSEAGNTTVIVNTVPVSRFAIIPLQEPPRLLVTFTPQNKEIGESSGL